MDKIKILFLISLVIMLTNNDKGIAMTERPDYKTEIKEKFKQIDLSDGVSKEEAIIIAQNYVITMIEEGNEYCRKLVILKAKLLGEHVTSEGKKWEVSFPIRRGFNLFSPKEFSIFVNQKTGRVTVGGPAK
jgi:hypothetical protein